MPFSSPKRPEFILMVVAVAMVLSSWASNKAYVDAERLVSHTVEVRREATLLYRDLLRAETGQRGYLLTGRVVYLDDYKAGTTDAPARLDRLKMLTAKNSHQQERVSVLEGETIQKFAELADTVGLTMDGAKDRAYSTVNEDRGRLYMERIAHEIDAVVAEEDTLLSGRSGDAEWWWRMSVTTSVLAGVAVGVSMAAAGRKWRTGT